MDEKRNRGFFNMEGAAEFLKCGEKDILQLVREKKSQILDPVPVSHQRSLLSFENQHRTNQVATVFQSAE